MLSQWVIEEASQGQRRGILIPVLLEDNVRIPLGFRQVQAARVTDWQGQAGHLEFGELKAATTGLLGHRTGPEAHAGDNETTRAEESKASVTKVSQDDPMQHMPDGVYLDPETKLMWTIADNGKNINWHQANEYAKELMLGGYSDWRLPTIEELEKLYDPKERSKIRGPFKLTRNWVWISTKKGFGFWLVLQFLPRQARPRPPGLFRQQPGLVRPWFRKMMGDLVFGSFFEILRARVGESGMRSNRTIIGCDSV